MKVQFTVNNYVLGAKVKTTPTHKIIEQNRIDKSNFESFDCWIEEMLEMMILRIVE